MRLSAATTSASVRLGDVSTYAFVKSGTVWSASPADSSVRLVDVNGDGTLFRLWDEQNTRTDFEKSGTAYRPVKLIRDGRALNYNYNPAGVLTSLEDDFGNELVLTWDKGVITQIALPDGTLTYTYDWMLDEVNAPIEGTAKLIGVTITSGADSQTKTYHYEDADFPDFLTGITDERGIRYATFTYDRAGRVTETKHAGDADRTTFAYDNVNFKRTVTNPLSKEAVYSFSRREGRLKASEVEGVASTNCPASTSAITYSSAGFVASKTDEEGRVTTFTNDPRGRPATIIEGAGTPDTRTTTATWHADWNLPTQIVVPGLTTDLTWNEVGQLTSQVQTDTTSHTVPYSTNGQTRTWTYTYSPEGLLLTADGPLAGTGDIVTYTYDASGFLSTVTDEVGLVTEITAVNDRGQPTAIEDPNGILTSLDYDGMGRLITSIENSGAGQAVTSIEYDASGQITKITQPDASFLTFAYTDARRLVTVENNEGEKIEYAHDDMGNVTGRMVRDTDDEIVFQRDQTFDELGRLLKQIGVDGRTWEFGWDKTSLPTSDKNPRGDTANQGYDALGRLISESNHGGATVTYTRNARDGIVTSTDPRAIVTSYVRNGFGEVIQESSPDIGTTIFERDARGLQTSITDARGIETELGYDAAGRPTGKSYPSASAENIVFSYDDVASGNKGKGQLTGASDQAGSTAFVYDAFGRVASETRVIGGQTYVVGYEYDLAGKLVEMTYPSGRIASYVRDSEGRIDAITTKRDAGSPNVDVAHSVYYMPDGPLQSLRYGNDLSLWRTFDTEYRLGQLLVEDIGTTTFIKRFHGYTDELNLTKLWDDLDATRTLTLWYTAGGQITQGDGPWGGLSYFSDDGGNRAYETLVQGGVTTERVTWYSLSSNRAGSVTENGTPLRDFTYDAAGNIVTDDRAGTGYAYTHNARGRLSNLTVGGVQRGAYVYDAFDRLAIRTVTGTTPSGTTHTVQDRAGHIIVEATGAGATVREYIWLDDMPIAVIADVNTVAPKLWFVHADHLDRPIMMTDGTKTKVWEATWWPYGEAYSITGTASLDLRFPGQWFQAESGLHYNWHRQYDPKIGRYLQPDPLGMPDGPNRWWYAKNSPLMYADPEGQNPLLWGIAGGLGGGAIAGPAGAIAGGIAAAVCTAAGLDWLLDRYLNGPYDTPITNPKKFRNLNKGPAVKHIEDGSVWEPNRGGPGHGDRPGERQWKRWDSEKDYDKGRPPQSIWADGRVRK